MCTITLIATIHNERGLCNQNELYKIIEQINPDIIFEELSHPSFVAIYEKLLRDSLETKTIKQYLQRHAIPHLPVDLDANQLIDKRLKNDIEEMFAIFRTVGDYMNLSNQIGSLSEQFGSLT